MISDLISDHECSTLLGIQTTQFSQFSLKLSVQTQHSTLSEVESKRAGKRSPKSAFPFCSGDDSQRILCVKVCAEFDETIIVFT